MIPRVSSPSLNEWLIYKWALNHHYRFFLGGLLSPNFNKKKKKKILVRCWCLESLRKNQLLLCLFVFLAPFHVKSLLLRPNSGKISLDGEYLFFFFAYVTVFAQPAMDDNNSVYVEGLPYKERVYENSHGFERKSDAVLDRNGYKERVFGGGEEEDWRGESGPIKNIKK